jgi:gliding motility-associated-like protein
MKKTTLLSGTVSLPQNLLKKLLLTCFGMVALLYGYANTITSSVAGGNWNATASWTGGVIPGANDSAVISNGNITVNVNETVGSITIATGKTLTIGNGITLTVALCPLPTTGGTIGGWFTNNGTMTNGNASSTVSIGTNGSINGSTATVFRNLIINTTSATDTVFLNIPTITVQNNSGGGVLTLTNGVFKIGAGNTLVMDGNAKSIVASTTGSLAHSAINGSDGGTVQNLSQNAITLTAPTANPLYFYNFTNSSNLSITITNPNSVIINGTLKLANNQDSWGNANAPIYGNNPVSALYVNFGGQQYSPSKEWSASSGTLGTTAGYPNNVTLVNVGSQSNNPNITGSYTIAGTFSAGDGTTAGTIDLSGLTSFTAGGITINNGSSIKAPSNITVKGNWSRLGATIGTFNPNSGTVTFAGSTADTIHVSAGVENSFYNLAVNGSSSLNVKLNSPVTIGTSDTLTLTSGVVQTDATNILSITNTAITGITVVGAGSTTNMINGPVKWTLLSSGTNTYTFPVGSGTTYLPFIFKSTNTSAGNVATVQGFAAASGGIVDATMSALFPTAYWALATTASLVTGSSVSVSTPATAIAPYVLIAKSNGPAAAGSTYTSLAGTIGTFGVSNSNNIGTGNTFFFTLGALPVVSTLAATSITTTSATLNGAFNTGSSKTTSFDWGPILPYANTVNTLNSPINSSTAKLDSQFVTGLTANTLYHYLATDGTDSGSDVTFITAPNPPVIGTPTTPTGVGFTANWSAPAAMGGATYTYTVEVSTDPTFATGDSIKTGISSALTSYTFTNLAGATTYYYRVEAVNATANSVWSATSTPITTSLSPTPSTCTTGTGSTTSTGAITKATILPVIDGQSDPVWAGVPANNISNISVGSNTGNTQTWKAMWTTDSLYLLVHVTDPTLISQSLSIAGGGTSTTVAGATPSLDNTDYYGSDGVELTLDPDYSHSNFPPGYDHVNDVQFRFNLGATNLSGQSSGTATQFSGTLFNRVKSLIDYKVIVVPGGYNVEVAIPWGSSPSNPGVDSIPGGYGTIIPNKNIGLEVQVNDATGTGGRTTQYSWFNTSTDPYQNPSTFAEATLTTCTAPPIVVLPTVTAITATGATLGATVTSSGDALLTARGTAYTQSPDATATGNPLAEGGTAVSIYSGPARAGLTPQTKYYYLGYANNANNETGISVIDSFYTLSALPTTQPTLTAAGCAAVTLNWNAVSFPPSGQASQTGYLVIRSVSPTVPATTGITTRIATTQSTLPAGDTLIATIPNGATLTYTDATAQTGVTYNYILVPFTWDGVTADSTYNYFVTAPSGVTATPNSLPAPVAVEGTSPTCAVPFGSIGITPIVGQTYSIDGTNYFTYPDPTFTNLTPNTTYQVTTKNAGGCVSLSTPVFIDAVPGAPTAPTAVAVQATCTVSTGAITITATPGLTYSVDGTNYFTYPNAAFTNLPANTTYQVTAENASLCVSPPTAVTINPIPTTLASPTVVPTQPTCTVSTGQIDVTSPIGVQYTFDGGTTYGPSATDAGVPANATYQVGAKDGTCVSAFVPVVIDPIPTTMATPTAVGTQPTCTVSTGQIDVTNPTSGVTYSFDGGTTYGPSATDAGVPANATYQVGVEKGTCVSAFVPIVIDPIPTTMATPTAVGTQPTCTVSTGQIDVTNPTSGVTYSFDGGTTYGVSSTASVAANTTYQVGVENGTCVSAFVPVVINPIPTTMADPTVVPTQPNCNTSTGTIDVTSPTGVTYSFDGGTTYGVSSTASVAANATYQVGVENGTCISGFVSVVIDTIPTVPVVSITSNYDTASIINAGTQITLTGAPNVAGDNYSWTVSPSGTVDNPGNVVTTATPQLTSTYTLTVTGPQAGCIGSAQKTVTVNEGCIIYIPNAFTPNGDGFNDIWIIKGLAGGCYSTVSVDVYNRWGSLVYHSDNYSNSWNGDYQGHPVPDATYYYAVKATNPTTGVVREFKGSVTILR